MEVEVKRGPMGGGDDIKDANGRWGWGGNGKVGMVERGKRK